MSHHRTGIDPGASHRRRRSQRGVWLAGVAVVVVLGMLALVGR